MLDDTQLGDWCQRSIGSRPVRVLFRAGHLSEVIATELADGRQVVIKARPADARIAACTAVQAHLARAGFPCPAPLVGPGQVGGLAVTAEAHIPGGTQLPPEHGAAPYAALLARLVASAPDPSAVPSLAPSPPWTAWDHPGTRLWPDRDDHGRDLNTTPGPAWVDDDARRVRRHLAASTDPPRVGHGDWESQNIRWTGTRPLAVHDWDSVIAQPEPAIVGLAAAVWTEADAPGQATTIDQSADFIASYQAAAGRPWTDRETRDVWAAGLWVRLFNAKKDAADGGGPQLDRLAAEIEQRLSRAALDQPG